MKIYVAGSQIKLQATFTNSAGVGIDPTDIKLLWKNSTGAVTTKSSTAAELSTGASNGVYFYNLSISSTERTGAWVYRFQGTGAVVAAGQDRFQVLESEVST